MTAEATSKAPEHFQGSLAHQLGSTQVIFDESIAVRIVEDPYASVFGLVCAGTRDLAAGRDSAFCRAVSALRPEVQHALGHLVRPGASLSPDCLTPVHDASARPPSSHATMRDHLDRLRTLSDSEIEADFHQTFGGAPPRRWNEVRSAPRQWLHQIAEGLEATWSVIADEWERQHVVREQEARRLGYAAVTGSLDLALADAHPRGRVARCGFEFPDPDATATRIDRRTLVLTPLLAGLDLTVSNFDRTDNVYFAYPARPRTAPDRTVGHELEALLTASRASLLRLATTVQPMSHLARAAYLTPASVTHHVDWLERCGLVERTRQGRTVYVSITHRGVGLLELYDDPAR